jgi:hypothetical protein
MIDLDLLRCDICKAKFINKHYKADGGSLDRLDKNITYLLDPEYLIPN